MLWPTKEELVSLHSRLPRKPVLFVSTTISLVRGSMYHLAANSHTINKETIAISFVKKECKKSQGNLSLKSVNDNNYGKLLSHSFQTKS